jgi:hypothetical protein
MNHGRPRKATDTATAVFVTERLRSIEKAIPTTEAAEATETATARALMRVIEIRDPPFRSFVRFAFTVRFRGFRGWFSAVDLLFPWPSVAFRGSFSSCRSGLDLRTIRTRHLTQHPFSRPPFGNLERPFRGRRARA